MARLIYSALASADGYVEDVTGNFDWAAPNEEVHCFVNDLERPVGAENLRHLGRCFAGRRGLGHANGAWRHPQDQLAAA